MKKRLGLLAIMLMLIFAPAAQPQQRPGQRPGDAPQVTQTPQAPSRHGVELNGIVMISALLTYQTLLPAPDNDVAWAVQVQTFAATAWYHKKLLADLEQKSLKQVVDEARMFAFGDYMAAFQHYVKNDLKWESDLHYPTSGNVRPWTYVQNRYMDNTDALRLTMAKNPFLKVFVACGDYDMATCVGGAEFNFTHLAFDRQITDRVSFGYYDAGHMMYIRPSAQVKLKQDTAGFIRSTLAPARTPAK